ncbi:MAG: S9 family peptidase [Bacteroidetes bacterium MedPE-SWsnd-G2]|nr:MAG: S9 family peptidase [Bacteroidetes bacterium MedPE-SWsnd-G2]
MNYPFSKHSNVVDTYFGVKIPDPYRWLEDDLSQETKAWVKSQNEYTNQYLNKIPYRNSLKKRLSRLWDYEKISAPFKRGQFTYFFKNTGLQNQSVLYRFSKNNPEPELFLDPNTFSKDGTTALGNLKFSTNGQFLAYTISIGGSDWRSLFVIDVVSKKTIGEPLNNIKFSGISWYKNEGFYYSSYDKPEGSELSELTDHHKVYYHKLNTSQTEDMLIYGNNLGEKHRYVFASVTEDNRFLCLTPQTTTSGNKLLLLDLDHKENGFCTILDNTKSDTHIIDNKGSSLYLITNLDAPNSKVVKVNVINPQPKNWIDVIPETEHKLSVFTSHNYLFAEYKIDAISTLKQFNYNGELVREIKLPGIGSILSTGTKDPSETLYFSFTNYFTPNKIYQLDPESGESELYNVPQTAFNSELYESKQVFYNSKDGTKIPMIITYKKGINLNGKNQTILYGYGGFNISLTPSFSLFNLVWMEQGGVYAVPNIRGGGEYGQEWHVAGTKLNKQNVFDDFIAAAEYLCKENYTSSNYLCIKGGSNGGLLVGAVMLQCPKLFKVALPAVGVLDMLRYHTFTAGAGWAFDYGTSEDDKTMFDYLLAYSPLHNVKENSNYPATLITTSDHDDRVVPAHSFKFAAELQNKCNLNSPKLIRIETEAGHGAGTSVSKLIAAHADVIAFTLFNMGIETLPNSK